MKLIATSLMAAMLALPASAQVKAEVALRIAMERETVKGDLKGAIEQYKKIVADHAANAAVAAKALLRMGECYEKLGQAEARKTYERVLREYPTEKETVAAARSRLARGDRGETGVVVRQVWTGADVNLEGKPAPDGRHLTFVEWKSLAGNVAVRDLATGENRVLTHETTGYADQPVFSPDGKQIVYNWDSNKTTSLRLIRTDGSQMRILNGNVEALYPHAWSPDGKTIAAVRYGGSDKTRQLALVSASDGSVKTLKSTGWRPFQIGGFSPDGRFLVYSISKSEPSAADGGIFAIATDGSREAALIQGASSNTSPAWTPDGQRVVFLSDRTGVRGLWSIRIADGRPEGAAELVRPNTGDITNMGFTRDGTLYYGTYNAQRDIYVAGLDPGTLHLTSQPQRITDSLVGSNANPVWSPDGRSLAFFRGPDGAARLVIRSLPSGAERVLPAKFQDPSVSRGRICWFPDGRSLLVRDALRNQSVLRLIDAETGQEQTVLEGHFWWQVALSPDGKTLYYSIREHAANIVRMMKRDLETKREVEMYRAESDGAGFFNVALSPDGKRLAFSANVESPHRNLMTISTEGGTPNILYRGDYEHPIPRPAAWTKDGRYVLIAVQEGRMQRIWAIPAEGGSPRRLDVSMESFETIAASPDGRQLAFTGIQRKAELWVIKNLLPELRASR